MKRKRDYVSTGSASAKKSKKRGSWPPRKDYASVPRTRGAAVTGEMKYFDTELASFAIPRQIDWTGTEMDPLSFNTYCSPAVGAAVNQRIGKMIKVLKWKVRGHVGIAPQIDQAGMDNGCVIRIIAFIDKQTNASHVQGENVMEAATDANNSPHSFQLINNFGRFRVLKDITLAKDQPNASYDGTNIEVGGSVIPFKWTINFKKKKYGGKPLEIRFNANSTPSVADIVDNSLHVIANCSSTNLNPIYYCKSRVDYKE